MRYEARSSASLATSVSSLNLVRTGFRKHTAGMWGDTNSPFIIVRILGNDLPPRHAPGQTRRNLEFILRHERSWPELTKRWIVNRIWDRDEEARIIELLESHGQDYQSLSFDLQEYARKPFAYEPQTSSFSSQYRRMIRPRRARADLHARRHRANYAINNNGGRLAALQLGRQDARWILPWDGNCFITDHSWAEISETVVTNSHLPYFIVPMARVADNRILLEKAFRPEASEEPQVIFRQDAIEEFDPERPYGRRPKVDLLWRLGVPGPWDEFEDDPWDPPRPALSREAGRFAWAGWVTRLDSGHGHLERPTRWSGWRRGQTRTASIALALDKLDARVVASSVAEAPLLFDCSRLEAAAKDWSGGRGPLFEAAAAVMSEAGKTFQASPRRSWRDTIRQTLAWQISGQQEFARAAADGCRPLLARGKPLPRSPEELALSLDALQLLRSGGLLQDGELVVFRRRLARKLEQWTRGWRGARRSRRADSGAMQHDTRSAIVAAFLGRHNDVATILRRSHARFVWHSPGDCYSDSSPADRPWEWRVLARLAEKSGMGLFPGIGGGARPAPTRTAPVSSAPDPVFWTFTSLAPARDFDLESQHA